MKKVFFTCLMVMGCVITFAQPNNGFKGGVNRTYHSNSITDSKFSTEWGWQFGYAWNIKTCKNISIRTELVFEKNALTEQWPDYELIPTEDGNYEVGDFLGYMSKMPRDGYYLNLPLGVNYLFKNRYFATGGYQIGYSLDDLMGNRVGPKWAHSCFLGAGFHFKYFDVDLRYIMQLNEDTYVTGGYWDPDSGSYSETRSNSGKNNILQISLTVPLKWRD